MVVVRTQFERCFKIILFQSVIWKTTLSFRPMILQTRSATNFFVETGAFSMSRSALAYLRRFQSEEQSSGAVNSRFFGPV